MTLHLRDVFSLEVLDTRLTEKRPSRIAPDPPVQAPKATPLGPEPARWRTPEFYLYYAIIGVSVPLMIKASWDVSQPTHPNYHKFQHLLKPGWAGRLVDNSDQQYSGFRNNVPILFAVLIAHTILRKITTAITGPGAEARIAFDNIFSAIFLIAIHGVSYFKVLFILGTNYIMVKSLGRSKYTPWCTWIFNISLLFLNEWAHGYLFGNLLGPEYRWLDLSYGGIMPRWEVHFNITTLRLISFNIDYYWSITGVSGVSLETKEKKAPPSHLSDKQRVATSHAPKFYNFRTYVSYCLYSPLYLAGPIITYNDYLTQLSSPPLPSTYRRPVILFGLRFLFALGTMELIQNTLYVVAISKTASPPTSSWSGDTPFQLAMIGYFNLHLIWLKLLIPWRFFRLWSLVDHIDPPENIVRCMSDVVSTVGFWRGWHRSYNRWNIRYVYIPLGGAKRPVINMIIVFTFVALWHDISLNLLAWGWMASVFVVPEILAKRLVPGKVYGDRVWYRPLAALGAVGNMCLLFIANLVGFALGVEGVKALIMDGVVRNGWAGVGLVVTVVIACFSAVQLMFQVRAAEERRGIFLGC